MHLLIATTNPGKIREFRQMLSTDGSIAFSDLTDRKTPPVEETGDTFLSNACLKASAYAKSLHIWALADDSGLAVDALEGKPGVHSARWASSHGAGSGVVDNSRLLLKQLDAVSDQKRTARFVCALALADPAGQIVLTAGASVEGQILREPRGAGGFGYDPLFFVEELGKTTAELAAEEKHRISHRGKALRRMRALMERVELVKSREI